MIGFGCVVSNQRQLDEYALAGIERIAEPDTVVTERRDQTCIYRAYNEILDELTARDDLEAAVLLHQDLEIVDPAFMAKLRAAIAQPEVAIVGAVGGIGITGLGWWTSPHSIGSYGWDWLMQPEREAAFDPREFWIELPERSGEVDVLDGMLLAFPAWAARELRFDEEVAPGFHGYDVDICLEARRRGHRLYVADLSLMHHNDAALPDHDEFIAAHTAINRKWQIPAPVWVEAGV